MKHSLKTICGVFFYFKFILFASKTSATEKLCKKKQTKGFHCFPICGIHLLHCRYQSLLEKVRCGQTLPAHSAETHKLCIFNPRTPVSGDFHPRESGSDGVTKLTLVFEG